MKRILLAVCVTTALAVGAFAADQNPKREATGGKKGRSSQVSAARANKAGGIQRSRQVNTRQNVSAQSFRQQKSISGQTSTRHNRVTSSNANANRITARERGVRRAQATTANNTSTDTATNGRLTRRQSLRTQRALASGTNQNVTVNRTRNVNRNVTLVNNWRGDRFSGRSYSAFRNYRRAWHNRDWYHSHYGTSLVFVLGAPYFWSSGYWYPAWGYNPGYVYPYDGPIYGASTLTPDQIVTNVQLQLRDDGYYTGPIDGLLGPQTRYALAAFQADHGLAVTSAVDEPTLATLGLV